MSDAADAVEILIYSRPNCCLCDEAKLLILRVAHRRSLPISITEVDIDRDPDLCARFSDEVPVVFVGGKKAFKYRVVESEFVQRVERALSSQGSGG
jgi:hypothetical protein